jgi:hypothetical protein
MADEDGKHGGAADRDEAPQNVARLMARALWQATWSTANPDATPAERQAAWKAAGPERAEKLRLARRVLRLLAKRGVTLVAPADADADGED